MIEIEVSERVVVYSLGSDTVASAFGANSVAILGDEGVLLVDALGSPTHARQIEQLLRRRTSAPIRYVVVTHHHSDHCLGVSWFSRQGAVVVSHRDCRDWMEREVPGLIEQRQRDPALRHLFLDATGFQPDITFTDGLVLQLGKMPVEVVHPGGCHTEGDCYLYLPSERILICGDLLFIGYHFNYEHASMDIVRRPLEQLGRLKAEVLVPGHGRPGGPQALQEQRHYHDRTETIISAGLAEGASREEIMERVRAVFPAHQLAHGLPFAIDCVMRSAGAAPAGRPQ
jgi:glyoxylase-like metal-dependent hydrolase (beta-lactamase superfamily II)